MDNIPSLKNVLYAVKDDVMRRTAEEVIQAYNSEVEPLKQDFRKGLTLFSFFKNVVNSVF